MQTYFFPLIKEINHLPDLDLYYHQGFIPLQEANRILKELLSYTYFSDERSALIMAGKKKFVPRKQLWFSDPQANYRFAGNEMIEMTWPKILNDIKNTMNYLLKEKGILPFDSTVGLNAVLVNYYRHGHDHISWHSDKTGDLIKIQGQTIIASVTFGATRPFLFRKTDNHDIKYTLNLSHGDLLIMKGKTNDYWQHCLPKRINLKKPRINLTFRIVKNRES